MAVENLIPAGLVLLIVALLVHELRVGHRPPRRSPSVRSWPPGETGWRPREERPTLDVQTSHDQDRPGGP